jgi:hypothetical protein
VGSGEKARQLIFISCRQKNLKRMKSLIKYLLAIGLVIITYAIPYLLHPLFLGLDESYAAELDPEYIWLAILIMSLTLSIVTICNNKYDTFFSIYSCILGLSFAYFIMSTPSELNQFIILPIFLGIILLCLHVKELKRTKKKNLIL